MLIYSTMRSKRTSASLPKMLVTSKCQTRGIEGIVGGKAGGPEHVHSLVGRQVSVILTGGINVLYDTSY